MKNIKKWIALILLTHSLPGCTPLLEQRSVTQVLNNKKQYHDKEIIVSGVLTITPQTIAICEKNAPRNCLNLEITRKIINELSINAGTTTRIKGIYVDHEIKSVNGESIFYPSRLIASEIIK